MARLKVLLLVVVALALVFWAMRAGGGLAAGAATQADQQLSQVEKGVLAAVEAQPAHQRAVADELTHDPGVVGALARAAAKPTGAAVEDAPALQSALEQALAKLPEGDRAYAAAAMATPAGAVAIVPSHEPIAATTFAWLDAAAKSAAGVEAEVAGRKVWVYAAPVWSVQGDKAAPLGTLAVAYARDDAALQKLADAFAPLTLVASGKVVATSDKAHADAAAHLTAPGTQALSSGKPASLAGLKLPLEPATLVQARAFAVPGRPGMLAVVAADLGVAVASAAEVERRGLIALLAILVLGLGVTALSGGTAPAKPSLSDWDHVEPGTSATAEAPAPSAAASEPEPAPEPAPEPEPEPILASETVDAPAAKPPPPPPPTREVPAVPLPSTAAAADAVPGFDALFGPSPTPARPAAPTAGQVETRAEVQAAPPQRRAPAAAPPSEPERTGLMSRDMLSVLAAQSSMPQPDAGAIPLPGSARPGSSLPPAGAETDVQERTSVSAVPLELLRAATRPAPPTAPAAGASEEAHFQDVYREFMQTRERCGEPPENLTFEKFAAKLRKNKEQLVQKYACKSVRFQVYVKEGKAALKATPVKDS